jgi:hypothetical protein
VLESSLDTFEIRVGPEEEDKGSYRSVIKTNAPALSKSFTRYEGPWVTRLRALPAAHLRRNAQ